jgi:hypothetical protein
VRFERTPGFWIIIVILAALTTTLFYLVFWAERFDLIFYAVISGFIGSFISYTIFNRKYPNDMVSALDYIQKNVIQRTINMKDKELDDITGRGDWYVYFPNEKPPVTVHIQEDENRQFVPKGILKKSLNEIKAELNELEIEKLKAKESILGPTIFQDFRDQQKNGEGVVKI